MSLDAGKPTKEDWVKTAFHHLALRGSWCGRLHAHKLLVTARLLGQAAPPFNFTLYQYGPYSFDLDSRIAEMEAFGELACTFKRPGYGPSYSVVNDELEGVESAEDAAFGGLAAVAKEIGGLGGKELELISTCLWVRIEEKLENEEAIIERVSALKPRFAHPEIRSALVRAQKLEAQFQAA